MWTPGPQNKTQDSDYARIIRSGDFVMIFFSEDSDNISSINMPLMVYIMPQSHCAKSVLEHARM